MVVGVCVQFELPFLFQTYYFTANLGHAPSVAYLRMFLKHILKLCEENDFQISDQIYEAYGEVLGKVEQRNDKCYKSYTLVRTQSIENLY